jgi:hypothetical protein
MAQSPGPEDPLPFRRTYFGKSPLGLSGDLRLGVAPELARMGQPDAPQRRDSTLYSLALHLAEDRRWHPCNWASGRAIGAGQRLPVHWLALSALRRTTA